MHSRRSPRSPFQLRPGVNLGLTRFATASAAPARCSAGKSSTETRARQWCAMRRGKIAITYRTECIGPRFRMAPRSSGRYIRPLLRIGGSGQRHAVESVIVSRLTCFAISTRWWDSPTRRRFWNCFLRSFRASEKHLSDSEEQFRLLGQAHPCAKSCPFVPESCRPLDRP